MPNPATSNACCAPGCRRGRSTAARAGIVFSAAASYTFAPALDAGNADFLSAIENVHFNLKGTPSASEIELLIYLLDPARAEEDGEGEALKGLPPVVAIGLSFPSTKNGEKVEYKVNNVAWTQEYGGAD